MDILASIEEKIQLKIAFMVAILVLLGISACATDEAMQRDVSNLKQQVTELNRRATDADVQIEELNNRLFILQDKIESGRTSHQGALPLEKLKVIKLVPKGNNDNNDKVVAKSSEQAEYDRAFLAFKEGRLTDSLKMFKRFADVHQTSKLTDNAHYWIGRIYMEQKEYRAAVGSFMRVFDYPWTNKGADALLQIATAYEKIGNQLYAQDTWQQILDIYPVSEAAKIAAGKLSKIKIIPQQ